MGGGAGLTALTVREVTSLQRLNAGCLHINYCVVLCRAAGHLHQDGRHRQVIRTKPLLILTKEHEAQPGAFWEGMLWTDG